jgi:hypothetical protein
MVSEQRAQQQRARLCGTQREGQHNTQRHAFTRTLLAGSGRLLGPSFLNFDRTELYSTYMCVVAILNGRNIPVEIYLSHTWHTYLLT